MQLFYTTLGFRVNTEGGIYFFSGGQARISHRQIKQASTILKPPTISTLLVPQSYWLNFAWRSPSHSEVCIPSDSFTCHSGKPTLWRVKQSTHVEFYGDVSIFQRQSCSSKGAHPPTTSGNLIYNAVESHHVWFIYEIIKLHGPYIPCIDPYSKVEGPHRQEQISQQIYGKQINSELCHLEEECGEVGWAIGGVGKKHLNFRWNSSCTVVIDFWKIIFLLNMVYLWIYIWSSVLIVGGIFFGFYPAWLIGSS